MPAVLAALAANNIVYGKGAPSLSKPHQDLDNTTEFRDGKTGMRSVAKNRTKTKSVTLERKLKEFFINLNSTFPGAKPSHDLQSKLVEGLQQLVYVMQDKYHMPSKMRLGWLRTGNHIEGSDPSTGETTVDYEKIMSKSRAEVTDLELDHMRAMKPQVVNEFLRVGRVSDAFLDDLGVVKDFHNTSRDELTLSRQDAQLLTHEATVIRVNDLKAQRELEKDPVHIAFNQRLSQAAKAVTRKVKADAKAAADAPVKAAKIAAKALDTARFKALPRVEQVAETAMKKESKRLSLLAKKEQALRDMDTAMELLGPETVAQLGAAPNVGAAPAANAAHHPDPPPVMQDEDENNSNSEGEEEEAEDEDEE